MSDEHFKFIYLTIVRAFDDKTATQYLRDDGEGGFAAGVYRMAREIERLRAKCGEPAERDRSWELEEDMQHLCAHRHSIVGQRSQTRLA